ncbi:MAG: cytochrome c biogenesis protein CcsA [Gammaproteobacteria bacterium]|nr:cytochrome c biogenesis protein CcsA [Gammaproteobacteria bacterium]
MLTLNITISILLYAAATGLLLKQWLFKTNAPSNLTLYGASIAVIFHAFSLYSLIFSAQGIDIGFFSALTFTAWLMALLLVVASSTLPIACLGLLVYPFALVSLLLRAFSDQQHILTDTLSKGLEAHILFSLLAYSLLSIAAAQAILLSIQDRYLHNKHPSGFLYSLPSLETMEIMLFRIIGLGVIALSISLLSGFVYLENMFAQHLVHKTVLSLIAWAIFVTLLWGHFKFGWRGKKAIKWSISGFILLMLAYFGSKFVLELVLQH